MGKLMCFLGLHKRRQHLGAVGRGPLLRLTMCSRPCCKLKEWEKL